MKHYVYYSFEEWGRGYIGVKSSEDPVTDGYFGSYVDPTFQPTNKVIIAEFPTREEAQLAEISLHEFFEVSENPHFANRCQATSTGFLHNVPHTDETKAKMKVSQKERFKVEDNPMKGRKHSSETTRQMSAIAQSRSKELIEKHLAAMNTPEAREKARNSLKGKPWSPARRKAHEERKSRMTSQ
jgi:hypothetical protein